MKVPVVVGDEIPEILIGWPWLEDRRLVVDQKTGILTLEYEQKRANASNASLNHFIIN